MSLEILPLVDEWPVEHRVVDSEHLDHVVDFAGYLQKREVILLGGDLRHAVFQ